MPIPGLAHIGFMAPEEAGQFLQNCCINTDPSKSNPYDTWVVSVDGIGPPVANAGLPDVRDIPNEYGDYLNAIVAMPSFSETFGRMNSTFKLVEIDPLLSHQYHVELSRSSDLCDQFQDFSNLGDAIRLCLPQAPKPIEINASGPSNGQNALLVRSKDRNLRVMMSGVMGRDERGWDIVGIGLGQGSAFAQVAKIKGRHFLLNGYHRAYGIRKRGGTHIPCVFYESPNYATFGPMGRGRCFEPALLESANPPTVGHFTSGRAASVELRRTSKAIHVTWTEFLIPEE